MKKSLLLASLLAIALFSCGKKDQYSAWLEEMKAPFVQCLFLIQSYKLLVLSYSCPIFTYLYIQIDWLLLYVIA